MGMSLSRRCGDTLPEGEGKEKKEGEIVWH